MSRYRDFGRVEGYVSYSFFFSLLFRSIHRSITTNLTPQNHRLQRGADLVTLTHSNSPSSSSHLSTSIPIPILWTHGSEDKICAMPPSQALFNRLEPCSTPPPGIQGKTFKVYEGAYHKIHCEPDGVGVGFAEDVGKWIRDVVGAEKKARGEVDGTSEVGTGTEMGMETETTEMTTRRESESESAGSSLNSKAKL